MILLWESEGQPNFFSTAHLHSSEVRFNARNKKEGRSLRPEKKPLSLRALKGSGYLPLRGKGRDGL
jgi:hypothetical protein